MISKIGDLFRKYLNEKVVDDGNKYFELRKSLAKRVGVRAKDIEISRFDGEGIFGTSSISLSNICSVNQFLVNAYNFVADVKGHPESYLIQSSLDYELLAFRKFERLGNSSRKGIEDLK
ncbi:MAG: hypothetical protein V1888_01710 [archaeon]